MHTAYLYLLQITNHSAESMSCRMRKIVLPNIRKYDISNKWRAYLTYSSTEGMTKNVVVQWWKICVGKAISWPLKHLWCYCGWNEVFFISLMILSSHSQKHIKICFFNHPLWIKHTHPRDFNKGRRYVAASSEWNRRFDC